MSLFIPKNFFVTKGKGVSNVSELNAFDNALKDAGISHCNLVPVSSILPKTCKEVEFTEIEPGSITFCILAKEVGFNGECISAGISYIANNETYGIVAEDHGHCPSEIMKKRVLQKLHEMGKVRGVDVKNPKVVVESLDVPIGKYGCVLVALVFVPW